ncbi:TetR/AcrR family transcriptional regulator [Streptomyces sp. NPDC127108]|uniref:TetR/AcrR family transcriptional regulator n=1 Tax=Streptomyces sp. NPDC127108 TaxID=3345361 RepID=UPI003645756A
MERHTGQPRDEELGLRERKKRRTRQRITDEATLLILRRGFEQVTVAEVAAAAEVSTMTVFNHFPRKEDLFLDRVPEGVETVTRAVADRRPGETPLAALRRRVLELLDERHPFGAVGESFPRFWQVVLDSPALRSRAREALEELEDALAAALARAAGEDPAAPGDDTRLTAALTLAAYRTAYATTARRQLAGTGADEAAVGHRELVHRAFDALERAVPRPRPRPSEAASAPPAP